MDFSLVLCLFLCFASCLGKNSSTNTFEQIDIENFPDLKLLNVSEDDFTPDFLHPPPSLIVDYQRLDWNATLLVTIEVLPFSRDHQEGKRRHKIGNKSDVNPNLKEWINSNNKRTGYVLSKATSSEKTFWAIARLMEIVFAEVTYVWILLFAVILLILSIVLFMSNHDRLNDHHLYIFILLMLLYTFASFCLSIEVTDVLFNMPLNTGPVILQSCLMIIFPRKTFSTCVRLLFPRVGSVLSTVIDVALASIIICQPIMEFAEIYRNILENLIVSRGG